MTANFILFGDTASHGISNATSILQLSRLDLELLENNRQAKKDLPTRDYTKWAVDSWTALR